MTPSTLATCPLVVGVNVDIETLDHANAGRAGLFGRYSYGRYGLREGIWRLLDAFGEQDVKATFFVPADDLARHPELVDAIQQGGHEIAVRGTVRGAAGSAETLDTLARDRETVQGLTGAAPKGWRALNGLVTQATLPALAHAGYLYDSSFQDDDVPYAMASDPAGGGAALVELPVFDYLSDAPFFSQRHTHARAAKAWAEEAHAQYVAGGYVNLTLHTRGDLGAVRLPQVHLLSAFLREMLARPGVRNYRADTLAQLWLDQHEAREAFPTAPVPQI